MFKLQQLTPMQLGRVEAALNKKYNYGLVGIMTLREFLESRQALNKQIGDHRHKYNRRKFNNMNYEQQKAYEKSLAKPSYNVREGQYSWSIPKIVYDILDIPEVER